MGRRQFSVRAKDIIVKTVVIGGLTIALVATSVVGIIHGLKFWGNNPNPDQTKDPEIGVEDKLEGGLPSENAYNIIINHYCNHECNCTTKTPTGTTDTGTKDKDKVDDKDKVEGEGEGVDKGTINIKPIPNPSGNTPVAGQDASASAGGTGGTGGTGGGTPEKKKM